MKILALLIIVVAAAANEKDVGVLACNATHL
jgi:hypothetical protein